MVIRQWGIDEVTILEVSGSLDVKHSLALRESVCAALRAGRRRLVLNLNDVTRVDAAGLGEIAHAHKMSRIVDGEMKLVVRSPAVRELLKRTRLACVFAMYSSEAAAIVSYDAALTV